LQKIIQEKQLAGKRERKDNVVYLKGDLELVVNDHVASVLSSLDDEPALDVDLRPHFGAKMCLEFSNSLAVWGLVCAS
jgi:hypothetical protein